MAKTKKRILSLAMALVMVFTLLPVSALAEDATEDGGDETVVECTKAEDCPAETHVEGCPKYVAPDENNDEDQNGDPEAQNAEVPSAVQAFLDAVGALEETEDSINACGAAYNALTEEEQAREDVKAAYAEFLAVVEAFNEPVVLQEAKTAVYVSNRGNDSNTGTTQDTAVATLAKAVEIASDGATIYVLSNLPMTKCARFYNKNLTITSGDGGPYTVTRGDNFSQQQDNARSTYNPAMIEVGGTKIEGSETLGKSTLRLENITFDDAGKYEGKTFDFSKTDGTGGNLDYVQDSIIASYSGTGDITLGNGATLKNFGGMSAVYITGAGTLIMESGSVICDDENLAESANRNGKHAVTLIGASMEMEEGSSVQNIKNALAINGISANIVLNGTVSGINGKSNPVVRLVGNTQFTLGSTGAIKNNVTNNIATIYVHSGSAANFYGKISKNEAPCGAIYIVTNGGNSYGVLYDDAEITENTSTGKYGVVEVQQGNCTFTMNGGLISGNKAKAGAVQVRKGTAKFIMNGGSITNNELLEGGTGDAGVYLTEGGSLTAELNGGTLQSITADTTLVGKNLNGYSKIAEGFNLLSGYVSLRKDNKTVAPVGDSYNVKLGNASDDSIDALSLASAAKDWDTPIATFWTQRDGAAALTVGGLTKLNTNLPVYVLTQKTGEDGKPASDAPINIYAAAVDADGNVSFTLPGGDVNGSGCAVAIVQPTLDYGSVVITGPNKITENKAAETYEVPYTATYKMSQNLANVINQGKEAINNQTCKFTFVIKLDSRLTAKTGAGDYVFTSPIFDVDTVTESGSTLTVTCKLKDQWKDHISELPTTPMTLTGTGVLDAKDFAAGDTLATTGNIQVTISTIPDGNIYIPANSCLTEMAGLVEYTIIASAGNNGSISPSGEVSVTKGDSQTFTITPDSGYQISDVKVDDESVGAVSSYTFWNVDANHIINASFARSNSDDDDDDDGKDIKDPEVPLGGLQLNKDDHFAYIKGYADGTVRPNNFITRAQVATIFYRLMTKETRTMYFSESNDFSDVSDDYWANKAISTLSNAGIITGFSDGTFRPNAFITRAQFAAIAARFSVVTEDLPNPFSDVPEGYWAEDLIAYAADVGWVNGYADGTFRPTANITRAAAMKLINNVLERQVDEDGLLEDATQWNDCTPDDWCYYIVMEATNSHDWERRSKKSLVEDWTALTADPVWDE